MVESSDKDQVKKKITEITTFPVSFSLKEIKENLSINTNTPSKPSKKEIINQAFKFHSQGNISEATKYYQYFIKQGFKDHRVSSNYGVILKNLGNLQEAETLYRKAIELNPDYAEAHSNLGNILNDLGNLQEAEISYRKAIDLNPDFADANYNLGIILHNLGKSKEAEISYRKAIEIKPDYPEAHSNLGVILNELGKLQEAELSLRKAIELKSDYAEAHSNLGNTLNDLRKLQEAELSYRKAIEINPYYAEGYYNLGNLLAELGNLLEAELSLRKAIELKPDLVNAHIKLGEILFDLGKPEEASKSEWDAIKLDPSFTFLKSYRENSNLINKTAFYIYSYTIFNHFRPILEINPNFFEILIPDDIDKKTILKIRKNLKKDIKIRSAKELINKNLLYEKLVSSIGSHEYKIINNKNNIKINFSTPIIKLFGKNNIRLMYTAGKNKYTISSYWNKHYDGILCYGTYHEKRFKLKHEIPTAQMGYPRFDKYFKPGFNRDYLLKKFRCDPKKKTIVWLPTWSDLASIGKYIKAIASLKKDHNIVVRPHPSMRMNDPENYNKLFSVDFNYIDDNQDDNVQLYALADLMFFDYGGSMFGSLYLNKNFAFLDMKSESKNNKMLGELSSEDYLKSFFPDRIAKLDNLKSICNYCLENPPSESVIKSLREEFFNTSYQGDSAKRAYDLLISNDWLN